MTLKDLAANHGLNEEEAQLFREYTANRFGSAGEFVPPDPAFLKPWERILDYAGMFGAEEAINRMICPKRPVVFHFPQGLSISIHSSFAGPVPIICARDTEDFEALVTSVAYKGVRPAHLSETGAMFLSNQTTRFMILSAKPYSNVPAAELGLADEEMWREKSMLLRRGHECTHFFTKQTYGIANNLLHDEIIADFMGMMEAFGFYKAEWFLRFMGIIPGSGGRLIFYTETLPERVRDAVKALASGIAERLQNWSCSERFKAMTNAERIRTLCEAGLEGMLRLG